MEFKPQQPIYLQIADYVCEQILCKIWQDSDKISSIRELAVDVAVNPNTVARAYEYLEEQEIIYKQRGIGYFVNNNAHKKIIRLKKDTFLRNELPILFKTLQLLNIDFEELKILYDHHKQQS